MLLTLPYGAFIYRLVLHTRLEIRQSDIVVINPFRTRRVLLGSIDGVGAPGYHGLPIRLVDGSALMAVVGQKSNIAAARGVRRHADDLADALAARVADFRHVPLDAVAAAPAARQERKRQARAVLLFGGIALAVYAAIRILRG